MYRRSTESSFFLIPVIILIVIGISCITVQGSEISIGTIIDTVGMVDDHSSYVSQYNEGTQNYSMSLFRDSVLTNGGAFTEQKTFTAADNGEQSGSVDTRKIITFDAGETGAHMAASELAISTRPGDLSTTIIPSCVFSDTSSQESGAARMTVSAAMSILNARTIGLTSSSQIEEGTLDYALSVGVTSPPGNISQADATVSTTFELRSESENTTSGLYDRSIISGLIDTINRVYHAGEDTRILTSTSSQGMISHQVENFQEAETNCSNGTGGYGLTVYTADLLANGGNTSEIHTLNTGSETSSTRLLSYETDGRSAMQAGETALALAVASSNQSEGTLTCVMAQNSGTTYLAERSEEASASSQLMGVESAQLQSSTRISADRAEGTIGFSYQADITSPSGFDQHIFSEMQDPDMDGKFEDLNGNSRIDLQDLVLLFKNLEGLGMSNLSQKVDYNGNGRADFADVVILFNRFNTG